MSESVTHLSDEKLRVLNLEDNRADSELIQKELEAVWAEVELLRVETRDAFVLALEEFNPDVVISSFRLSGFEGRDALSVVRQLHPEIPVIMVADVLSDLDAVDLMKMGAKDYVSKDHMHRLAFAVQHVLALEQGIRSRKETEHALRESQARYQAIMSGANDAIVCVKSDDTIYLWNRKAEEMFGYSEAEAIGQKVHQLIAAAQYRGMETEGLRQFAQNGTGTVLNKTLELIALRKNGVEFPIELSVSPMNIRGEWHATGIIRDITARNRIERQLRESEMQYRTLADSGQALIWMSDTKRRCVYCNQVWLNFTGRTLQQELGNGWTEAMHPDDIQPCLDIYTSSFDRREKFSLQYRLLRHDGEYRWLQDDGCPRYSSSGEFLGYLGYCLDITERKQAEANLQHLNQLYAALSQCNQAIVRSSGDQDLFNQVCCAAVKFGGFKMAWIGLVDFDTDMVKPVASFGESAPEYLHDIKISVDAASEYGQGPTGRAIRENQPYWNQDFLSSVATKPWRERGEKVGWRSSAALPISRNGRVIGAFTLYSSQVNAFDEAERELLLELAADISYALDNFMSRAALSSAMEDLLYANELMQITGEMARVGGWALEIPTKQVVWSDQIRRMHEVPDDFAPTPEQSAGLCAPEFGPVIQAALDAAMDHGAPIDIELALVTANNRRIWAHVQGKSIFENGRPVRLVGALQDITARKKAEESLRQLTVAVEQSPSSIVITDLDANIEYVNDAFTKVTGYSREEVIGKNPRILHSGKTARATYDDMWAHLTQGEVWQGELINCRKDRSEYIESVLIAPVRDDEGRATHYLAVKMDITERKRAEAELAANFKRLITMNEQLEKANQELKAAQHQVLQSEKMASIGLLAAGVAHEINNPIGYINSNLGTLEKYLADIFAVMNKHDEIAALNDSGRPEMAELRQLKQKVDIDYLRRDIKSLLAESREGLERVKEIILDLKDFSRSGSDEAWQWADLHKGLESTITIIWNELKYKCQVVRDFGALPQIYCLPSQLNQVFMNLLVNAAQAIETRGTITIRTGQEGDSVWVEIEDTGKGIPDEIMPRIFDPFFTTKPVGKGTGLGLPVSYGIVERHHGRIEVKSEVGKGTVFRVWLPVQSAGNKEAA